jgi:hypothetical protein
MAFSTRSGTRFGSTAAAAAAAPAAPTRTAGMAAATAPLTGAASAAAAPAAGAASAASAAPLYIYWTSLAGSARAPKIFVSPLLAGWTTTEETDLARSDLETSIVGAAGLCGINVARTYLMERTVHTANKIVLVISEDYITMRRRGDASIPTAKGFILANPMTLDGAAGYYIDIVCAARGFGGKLMNFFHTFAFDNGASFVKLSSLANVLTYYPTFGYEFRKTCSGPRLATLPATLTSRNFKARPAPEDTPAAYEDKDYMDFMYNTLYRVADLGVRDAAHCKDRPPALTRAQFGDETHDCAQDGFTMIKCSRGGGARRRTRRSRGKRSKTHRSRRSTRRH